MEMGKKEFEFLNKCKWLLLPGAEGKAGMVAIADEDGTVDLTSLASDLARSLPVYARPVFVRLMNKVETTSMLNGRYGNSGYCMTTY